MAKRNQSGKFSDLRKKLEASKLNSNVINIPLKITKSSNIEPTVDLTNQPPSHQGSEPLTRSSARRQQPHTPRPQGTTALIFLIAIALGAAVLNEDRILRFPCMKVFLQAAAALVQREGRKAGDAPDAP